MITADERRHLQYIHNNDGWVSQAYFRRNEAALANLVVRHLIVPIEGTRALLTDFARAELGLDRKAQQQELAL